MRDTVKQADQGRNIIKKNSRIDLSAMELNHILRHINDEGLTYEDMIEAVTEAFYMGVAVGSRNKSRSKSKAR